MREVKICFGGSGGDGGDDGGDLFQLVNTRTTWSYMEMPLLCSEAPRACGLLVKHEQTRPAASRVL